MADREVTLVITGTGDVLSPEHDVIAIGSGGNFAQAAALGIYGYEDEAETVAHKAMEIAASICVYTNTQFTVETLDV